MSTENYYAPPAEAAFDDEGFETQEGTWEYAGFWQRFWAYFVDALILGLVTLPLTVGPIILMAGFPPNPEIMVSLSFKLMQIGVGLIVSILATMYYAVTESGPRQATWGKRLLKIHVADLQGAPLSFGQAAMRYLWRVILPTLSGWIGMFLTAGTVAATVMSMFPAFIMLAWHLVQPYTEKRQAVHDMLVGAVVLKD